MNRPSLIISLMLAALIALTFVDSVTALDPGTDEPVVKITNSSRVYYPTTIKRGAKFKKPAIVVSSTVFDSIPEWKEIKEKGLKKGDAEYHLLHKRASDKFCDALKRVRVANGYDIVAETGAIECKNCTATEITQAVIDSLAS